MTKRNREQLIRELVSCRDMDKETDSRSRWTTALTVLALTLSDREYKEIKAAALQLEARYDRALETLV